MPPRLALPWRGEVSGQTCSLAPGSPWGRPWGCHQLLCIKPATLTLSLTRPHSPADYASEIPFEKKPAAGFYDASGETALAVSAEEFLGTKVDPPSSTQLSLSLSLSLLRLACGPAARRVRAAPLTPDGRWAPHTGPQRDGDGLRREAPRRHRKLAQEGGPLAHQGERRWRWLSLRLRKNPANRPAWFGSPHDANRMNSGR